MTDTPIDPAPTRSTPEQILDIAERMARTGGYGGFSFRDIAAEVGIKAASVHYHFPSKERLGTAVAERYTERFLSALGDPADSATSPGTLLTRYIASFRDALTKDQQMCLCGVLGAEHADLPSGVSDAVRGFFSRNIEWLTTVFTRAGVADPGASALRTLATLEGALLVAGNLGDPSAFDSITRDSAKLLQPKNRIEDTPPHA